MMRPVRRLSLCLLAALLALPVFAQSVDEPPEAFHYERSLIESVLGTVVKVIQEAAYQAEGEDISTRLREMALELNPATSAAFAPGRRHTPTAAPALRENDLQELRELLDELYLEVQALRREVRAQSTSGLSDQLASIEVGLKDAVDLTDQIARRMDSDARQNDEWLQPGTYGDDGALTWAESDTSRDDEDRTYTMDDGRRRSDWHRRGRDKRAPIGPGLLWGGTEGGAMLGRYPNRWPYTETALYRNTPAIRYNRAEGFVLGVGLGPLDWNSYRRVKLVGQLGYAFALERWRYEIGAEYRPHLGRDDGRGIKFGASYRYNTVTEDLWKSNWIENTFAAFLFRNDFFDYYQVEGWSAYAVARSGRSLQVSAAFRSEEHSSLAQNADWSLFSGDFRPNPPVDPGRVQSLLFAIEAGRVRSLNYLPIGAVFRAEAEIAPSGFGSDFTFSRYIADGRLYLPVSAYSSLGFRLRGGLVAGGDHPFQKGFTLGGVGTVPGYGINAFYGTRMLLGNAEYMIDTPDLFDDVFEDLQVFGTANAGWTGSTGNESFSFDDVYPSLGIGVALDERNLRFELAWPLKDTGNGYAPSLWFRLSPTF